MDREMEKIMGNFGIPDEFMEETPEEEILYDWDGGVVNETE